MSHRGDASKGPARFASILPGVLLAWLAAGGRAWGEDVLYRTGFEAPGFAAGKSVDGQGGFAVTTGAPGAITVTTDRPHSGTQALLFTGGALSDSPPPIGPGFFIGTAGVATNYDVHASGNSVVILEASVRLDGPSTATGVGHTGDLVSINLEANLGNGSYFSTYLSSDGNAYGFSTGYDAMTPAALGAYHELELVLDFASRTSTYIVDGHAFGTQAFASSVTSTVLASATLSMYDIDPPASRSSYTARVDDISVAAAVPEPPALALAGTAAAAGLGLAWRWKRSAGA